MYRESKKLEKEYADRTYQNIIEFLASDPKLLTSQGASFLPLLLSEIKNIEPVGRVTAEFKLEELNANPIKDIYVNDKDKIYIPKYESTVFVFGEVSSPGAIPYIDGKGVSYYLNSSGGVTKFAENKFTYVVSPNGVASRVNQNGLYVFRSSNRNLSWISNICSKANRKNTRCRFLCNNCSCI